MKKVEKALRLSQAAVELGTSRYALQKLCQLSMIEAERTPGGHWRIPCTEIERLKTEGLPAVPALVSAAEADDEGAPPSVNRKGPASGLLGPPSKKLIAIKEKRMRIEDEVETLRQQFEQEELQREIRAARRAEQEEEQQRAQDHKREQWFKYWLNYAMSRVPIGSDLRSRIRARVLNVLDERTVDDPTTQEQIDEIILDEKNWDEVQRSFY